MPIYVPDPALQITFSYALAQIRTRYLQDALSATVEEVDLAQLDGELNAMVPRDSRMALAKKGLRTELLFPAPCLLRQNPFLIGYYRLVLGFSKKAFYRSALGLSPFKSLEEESKLSKTCDEKLPELCEAIIRSAIVLLDEVGADRISRELLHDLALLTVGPMLRGGNNVEIGAEATGEVFRLIHELVEDDVAEAKETAIYVKNAAGRKVLITFAPDPDIAIVEITSTGSEHNKVAIEVKGGTDFSNVHNRIGEAEKSHQKAKGRGFVECWTVVNVDALDVNVAREESPTTNRFYILSQLIARDGDEYRDFKERLFSNIGISGR